MSEMDRLHSVLREALVDFVAVCEKYQIPYYLVEGSCLGAVRHQGFIPWDDDMDVAVPAKYYDTFISAFANEFPSKYEVAGCFSWENFPDKSNTLTRIYIPSVNLIDRSLQSEVIIHPFIDVMHIYGFGKTPLNAKLHFYRIFIRKLFLKMSDRNTVSFNAGKKRGFVERMFLNFLKLVDTSKLFSTRKCWEKLNRELLRYDYDRSKFVSVYPSDYRLREIMPKSFYGDGRKTNFEGIQVQIPADSDSYLTQLYGDYMQLPPKEKQVSHHRLTIID